MLGSKNEWNCWASMDGRQGLPFLEKEWDARGCGGYGVFCTYMPFSEYTEASFLRRSDLKTPIFVRFGSLEGNHSDTGRDTKGMAVKFQTEQGEYDLLCSSFPVSAYNTCESFCDYLKAISPDRASNLRDIKKYWEYMAGHDVSVHKMLLRYSDLGTRKNYAGMEWFSLIPYEWINAAGEVCLVRYCFRPVVPVECITRQEAEFLTGFDPDIAGRGLYDTLSEGKEVRFEMTVQLIPEGRARALAFDPLDSSCRWNSSVAKEYKVGILELQKPCTDYETELAAGRFALKQVIQGIKLPNMPLARLMSLMEKQKCCSSSSDVFSFYEYGKTGRRQLEYTYQQASAFYGSLSAPQQQRLRGNLLDELIFMEETVQKRITENLYRVNEQLAKEIEKGLVF